MVVGFELAVRLQRSRFAEVVLAAALAAVACLVGAQYQPHGWDGDPRAYALTLLIFLPLALRRRIPVVVWLVSCLALAGYLLAGFDQVNVNFWGPLLALYSVASVRTPRQTAWCWAFTVPVLYWCATRAGGMSPEAATLESVLFPTMAWSFGTVGLKLTERNRQLDLLTAQLREEQQQRAATAVARERVRIARELHDVVAHHISVVSIQAGLGSYVFDTDPPTARLALDTIGKTSREALQELRRLLVLLRVDTGAPGYDTGGWDPAPSLADLPRLVDRMHSTGLDVTLEQTGAEAMAALAPGLQLCAYRVVQEALTNALKHAWSARTNVYAHCERDELTIRVTTDKDHSDSAAKSVGTGLGIGTMRERAALYGGTLQAGPRPGGGFEVALRLPNTSGPHGEKDPGGWGT